MLPAPCPLRPLGRQLCPLRILARNAVHGNRRAASGAGGLVDRKHRRPQPDLWIVGRALTGTAKVKSCNLLESVPPDFIMSGFLHMQVVAARVTGKMNPV